MSEKDWDELPEPEFDATIKHYGQSPSAGLSSEIKAMEKELARMKALSKIGDLLIKLHPMALQMIYKEARRLYSIQCAGEELAKKVNDATR